MKWKAFVTAACWCSAHLVYAQTAASMVQTDPPATVVDWQIDVVRDGQSVDTFANRTALGQASTATHHHETTHDIGCKDRPAAKIDLARTITVSPVAAAGAGITLAIDADETVEDDVPGQTPEGCRLPPTPRRVSASHPAFVVPAGQWAAWTLIEHDPTLVYRVHASVAAPR